MAERIVSPGVFTNEVDQSFLGINLMKQSPNLAGNWDDFSIT